LLMHRLLELLAERAQRLILLIPGGLLLAVAGRPGLYRIKSRSHQTANYPLLTCMSRSPGMLKDPAGPDKTTIQQVS
jgi:hypothetical protein